jgi:hypothetical protein
MENLWKWVCVVFAGFLELELDFLYWVFFVGFLIGGIFEELVKVFFFLDVWWVGFIGFWNCFVEFRFSF